MQIAKEEGVAGREKGLRGIKKLERYSSRKN